MSSDTARILYLVSLGTPHIRLEDVFLTGICARKAKIIPKNYDGFLNEKEDPTGLPINSLLAVHNLTAVQLHQVWKELQQNKNKATWPSF